MDPIFKSREKLQAMKYNKNGCFLNKLILHSLIALLCTLFGSYYFCMNHFASISLQKFIFSLFNPKCLFIIGNAIVAILVLESKLASSRSCPVTEIYDEYVKRSQNLRKASTYNEKKFIHLQEKKNSSSTRLKKENMYAIKESNRKDDHCGEEEVPSLVVEEFNKRVEDFIARVNKKRWLEEYRM